MDRETKLEKLIDIAKKLNELEIANSILNKEYGEVKESGLAKIHYQQIELRGNRGSERFDVEISKKRMKLVLEAEIEDERDKLKKLYNSIYGE